MVGTPATSRTRNSRGFASPRTRRIMNSSAVLTFVLIAGIVWGGFLLIVATAIGKESRKKKDQG